MFRRLGLLATRAVSQPQSSITIRRNVTNLYEPPYLALLKPEFPTHKCFNIRITGYDFTLLETYQKYLYSLGVRMDLGVYDGWATPGKISKITRLQPNSTIVDATYELVMYERNVLIEDVPAPALGSFLRLAQAGLPQGVSIDVVDYMPEQEKARYVPDRELLELKDQLEDMGGASKKPRKK